MFGPDITFLGVEPCDLSEPGTLADVDVVIVGAPFDGGTSHRPGTRFGPELDAHFHFHTAGTYQLWAQFRLATGKVVTVPFTVRAD